ncbi:MAG: hypothetical protein FJ288_09525 [Planctomycetes bacterium]|nr:hypothetical protein [Planctomycetota bacterium]
MKRMSVVLAAVLCVGVALTVQSAARPTGAIKVPAHLALELKVDNKPVAVPSGREITMLAGTYTPASLTAQATANNKGKPEVWSIKSTGPFGQLQQIEIKEGCTSAIDAGPPFTLKAIVYKAATSPQGKVVPIGFAIVGKAGEVYAANSLRKGQSVTTPPQFQILDEKGTVLTQGAFAYG